MANLFPIPEVLSKQDDAKSWIIQSCDFEFSTQGEELLDQLLLILPEIDRFKHKQDLDHWVLEVNQTEDEGIEILVHHDILDLLVFLMEDDDTYELEDLIDNMSLDAIFIPQYHSFLQDKNMPKMLIEEVTMWEIDSDYHPNALDHLKAVISKGFDLAPFGRKDNTEVEMTWDIDEIFVGASDDDSMSTNPDYNLAHEHFDITKPEESMEMGLQSWSSFDDEDDDWDDISDDDEYDDDFDDDWDAEVDEEWDPGFDDENDDD